MKQIKLILLSVIATAVFMAICSCTLVHKHEYTEAVINEKYLKAPADCSSAAVYYYSCLCGECGTEESIFFYGTASEHSFENYVPDGNAACESDGTKTAKCEKCDMTDTIAEEGSALGHSYTNYIANGDATCDADGTKTAICDRCDKTDTKADKESKLPHTYSSMFSKNETHHWYAATCGHDARRNEENHTYVDKICTLCGYHKPEALIESIENATINGTDISIVTKADKVFSVLSSILCSEGASYTVFTNSDCSNSCTDDMSLSNGTNTVYIKVSSADKLESRIYTVTIYKSFKISVIFKDGDDVAYTLSADSGYIFSTDHIPDERTGYTFDAWMLDGSKYIPTYLYSDTVFTASFKPNEYTITLNPSGGNVESTQITVIYGEAFTLPTPSKQGCSFIGWFDTNGNAVKGDIWYKTSDISLIAKWEDLPGIQLPSLPI